MLIRFLLRALVAALGLWLAAKFVPGIVVRSTTSLVLAAVLLGLVNAGMLGLVAMLLKGFALHGFVAALLGSIVVSLVSWVGSWFIHRPER